MYSIPNSDSVLELNWTDSLESYSPEIASRYVLREIKKV